MKKVIEYFPFFSICLIFFGFCNLHYYFKEFRIEVYNYITLPEILLSFLPLIVTSSTFIFSFLIGTLVSNSDRYFKADSQRNNSINIKKSSFINQPILLLVITSAIGVSISLMLIYVFKYKDYELQELHVSLAFLYLLLIYSIVIRHPVFFEQNSILLTMFIIIYIGNQIGTYRRLEAVKLKNGKATIRTISFKYKNHQIKTSDSLLFIGETQNNIFLYRSRDSTTLIYKSTDIDSIIIK